MSSDKVQWKILLGVYFTVSFVYGHIDNLINITIVNICKHTL